MHLLESIICTLTAICWSLNLVQPEITVAAIIEQNGCFLMVEERAPGTTVFNQPAGHLEGAENFVEAVIRETYEETGRRFIPTALVGIYLWPAADTRILRLCFCGTIEASMPERDLDPDILATHWFDEATLATHATRLRSPLVGRAIRDYRAGHRYPLDAAVCLDAHGECP